MKKEECEKILIEIGLSSSRALNMSGDLAQALSKREMAMPEVEKEAEKETVSKKRTSKGKEVKEKNITEPLNPYFEKDISEGV